MIKYPIKQRTKLSVNESTEGETIEMKMERVVSNNEPIDDSAPIIYQERKEGVHPAYNPRTDRFDLAIDATDAISKSAIAKRVDFHTKKEIKPDGKSSETKSESQQS